MNAIKNLETEIKAQNWNMVEEQWLGVLDSPKIDLPMLIEALELLSNVGETRRAHELYDLLVDQLAERGDWEQHLQLQHHYRKIFGDHLSHSAIMDSLTNLYSDSELFNTLADKVGLHRATDDIPKTWTKADKLHGLMDLAPGTVVLLKGQGAGRVADINIPLGSFRVDLGGSRPVSVGFAAAPKVLKPLTPSHILYRKVTNPEGLTQLLAESPHDLLQTTLESYDGPMTANEIRTALSGVVPEKKWASFWNKVKKNSRLMALPGGRQRYQWAKSADDAASAIEIRFRAASLSEQLDLLKAHSTRDESLRTLMVETLSKQAVHRLNSEPGITYQIGVALEKSGEDLETVVWGPSTVLSEVEDPSRFIAQLGDRSLREDAYRRLPELQSDWATVYGDAIRREQERRTLDALRESLQAEGESEILERSLGDLLNHSRRSPGGFTWLAELAADDEVLLSRSPLRLFQQILHALNDGQFQAQRKRLFDLLDSGGTVPRLIHRFDAEQAARAEDAVKRSSGLEDYQKKPLENAIHLRYPELHTSKEVPLYTLQASLDRKRAELKELLEVEIPKNRKAIEEAREMGDLRENFEYKSARQRHEYLSSLATSLNRDLGRARVINLKDLETSSVRLGTRAELARAGSKDRLSYTILGPWESDPNRGILSNESELAIRLLGLSIGDILEIEDDDYSVRAIGVYSPS